MGVAKLEFFPFLTGIFGIKDEKSRSSPKKFTKKFRRHVLNSLLVGRLAVGELLEYRRLRFPQVRDTHPETPIPVMSALPPKADMDQQGRDVRFVPDTVAKVVLAR